jgi:hypothetical protein
MASYNQISQEPGSNTLSGSRPSNSSQLLRIHLDYLRIYYLAAVVCTGGLLFGYDSGVIGLVSLSQLYHV